MKNRRIEWTHGRDIISLQKIARCVGAAWITFSLIALQGLAAAAVPQKAFESPARAAQAMVDALRKDNRQELLEIFGEESKGLLNSGDPMEDKSSIHTFLKSYDQMHRFSRGPSGRLFLIVGAENWPLPIPLKKEPAGWYFDTRYGKEEMLFQRIGANELSAIRILNAIVVGEHEYYEQTHDNGVTKAYAQKIVSDEGTHDGLYWKTAAGEPESPIGPLVAQASQEGYRVSSGTPIPVRGYYFRLLTSQGKNAADGARDYVVDGKMTGGFAVLAYPASYRSSGVMTFLADAKGNILQKDLGPKSSVLAGGMGGYDPDESWNIVNEAQPDMP